MTPTWVQHPSERRPWLLHVNATATGCGVAELLNGLVRAQAAKGTAVGWAVIAGNDSFVALTKQTHHLLHGKGDAGVAVAGPGRAVCVDADSDGARLDASSRWKPLFRAAHSPSMTRNEVRQNG